MPECNHEKCNYPAKFHARVVTTGPITGEVRSHESGNLCHHHTTEASEKYNGNNMVDVKIESI